jgi:hypothetical protein
MKLVLVEWIDSKRLTDGWVYNDSIVPKICICKSVGWVSKKSNKHVLIVMPHRGVDEKTNYGSIAIPKCCIAKITKLRKER